MKKNNPLTILLLLLFCWFAGFTAQGQRLFLKGTFEVPKAVATAQDVQGNLYLATQQGQILQYSPNGKKGSTFSPNELLYISSLQSIPGMQLLAFDKNSQQLHWIERLLTLAGTYALSQDQQGGYIDVVAAADGNALWMVDGSQQRLIKKQFPSGELLLSVPLNLITGADQMKFTYMREYKGKLYLYSPTAGMLVFDMMGNYEQTLKLPALQQLWLDESRFYFFQKNVIGYLDLQTNTVVRLPVLETQADHLLVKGKNIWLLSKGEAIHYLMMPNAEATTTEK